MDHDGSKTNGMLTGGFHFQHDAWGRLVMVTSDGAEHVGVAPVRLFPLSDPDHWISLVDADGAELMCLESLEQLPAEARRILEAELQQREFLPMIRRIEWVSTHGDPLEWVVETDRGKTAFEVNHEDDVHRLGRHAAVVIDAHKIRYLIPDIRKLDPGSRKFLDRYV
jgi:hypothetical protein